MMVWSCETLENTMNYLKIWYDAREVFLLDIDRDRIGFKNYDGKTFIKDFSNLYYEMLDKQKKECYN